MKKLISPTISYFPKIKVCIGTILFISLLIFPNDRVSAQISGLVTEKVTGMPLEGVSVTVKNVKVGTTTNSIGR
jgi:hypothetical protein